ncbi:MAG: hypothetical protein V4517_00730 [Pseudomonadota bacterium]
MIEERRSGEHSAQDGKVRHFLKWPPTLQIDGVECNAVVTASILLDQGRTVLDECNTVVMASLTS